MKFTDFDKKMRQYEESLDQIITNGNYIIVRLDGRAFHTLVKECNYKRPFDDEFNLRMINTVVYLMDKSGFNIKYGYTQSDEISLLLDLNDDTYGRKTRKINSILASCATLAFNDKKSVLGMFDSRVIPLPNKELVKDYFMWRQEDCARNCLNSYCYWMLRNNGGYSKSHATLKLSGMKFPEKHDLLYQYGYNFNNFLNWQKRGIGIYWEHYNKESIDKISGKKHIAKRKRIIIDKDIMFNEDYGNWIIESFC